MVTGMQEQFALYADNFPVWSEQSGGVARFSAWLALTEAGKDASLQHYNPVTDDATCQEWHVRSSWKLRAQMPLGSHEVRFDEKAFMDDSQRFIVKG